jgi:F-type H+-transporting ATPase subunit b
MINPDLFTLLVTIIYVAILYVFLSKFFFGPLTRILAERRQATEGSLEEAVRRIDEVEKKTAEYESALREARAEAYKHQETIREEALEERARLLNDARREADRIIVNAHARLETETAEARKDLEGEIDALASRLSGTLLQD